MIPAARHDQKTRQYLAGFFIAMLKDQTIVKKCLLTTIKITQLFSNQH